MNMIDGSIIVKAATLAARAALAYLPSVPPANRGKPRRDASLREPQSEPAEELLDTFSSLTRDLRAAAAQAYASFEVGTAQAKLLRQIRKQSHISQAELARATASDPTLTGRVLATLIARGWVHRRRSDEDRREYVLELSARGQRVCERIEKARAAIARRVADALDARDRRDFARLARKLRGAFAPPPL